MMLAAQRPRLRLPRRAGRAATSPSTVRPGEVLVPARPERRRQDHAVPHAARPAAAARRPGAARRPPTSRRCARAAFARRSAMCRRRMRRYFPFTVRDVVLMGARAASRPFAAPRRRPTARRPSARWTTLGIAASGRARPTREISGGERQLALIARALAQEPRAARHGRAHRQPRLRQPGAGPRRIRALAPGGLATLSAYWTLVQNCATNVWQFCSEARVAHHRLRAGQHGAPRCERARDRGAAAGDRGLCRAARRM